MDKIALITGYIVIFSGMLICIVIGAVFLFVFYIPDKIAFRKYQKKSDKKTMDYARKEIVKSFITEELCRN